MYWNEETIRSAAPDAVTLERARALVRPRRWKYLLGNEQVIWGLCRSSGEAMYDTGAALPSARFYCSCPSRKRPCKHVLALLLLYDQRRHLFQPARDVPLWLADLRPARVPSSEPAASTPEIQLAEKRLAQMTAGVSELERWLLDLIRQGLAEAQAQDRQYWESMAARMVDAMLGGVARRIRSLPTGLSHPGWPERLLGTVSELYLFVQAFQNRDDLPPDLLQDLLSLAGAKIRKDDVLRQQGLTDRWLVLAQVEGAEENLSFRRSWLLGEHTQRYAMLLDFAWGNQGYDMDWKAGSVISGEVVFYPGAFPMRALVKKFDFATDPFEGLTGYADLDTFAGDYARALGQHPWLSSFPVLLDGVIPHRQEERLILIDRHHRYLPAQLSAEKSWKLIALSGGWPLLVFGEWDGQTLEPLTAFVNNRMVVL